MNIREACANIIGADVCAAIIADMGLHWAVFAAAIAAKTPRHDKECVVIRAWNAQQKLEASATLNGSKDT